MSNSSNTESAKGTYGGNPSGFRPTRLAGMLKTTSLFSKINGKDLMDTLKEIWISLAERFKNPLLYSFIISWVFINYKLPIVVFSDASYVEKISFIDDYFRSLQGATIWDFLCLPFLYSIFYVFLMPAISLLSTYATAVYERLHADVKATQSRKAILTKEQRERLESEVAELNNKLRRQVEKAETNEAEAEARMGLYVKQLGALINPVWFDYLNKTASGWVDVTYPPENRLIKGSKEQNEFVKKHGIPSDWAKIFEIIRRPEGVGVNEVAAALDIGTDKALSMLLSLSALNMLEPSWGNGSVFFKLIEGSWVALLNGRSM
jgi:hypothetical protein